jgi:hypothetical protein
VFFAEKVSLSVLPKWLSKILRKAKISESRIESIGNSLLKDGVESKEDFLDLEENDVEDLEERYKWGITNRRKILKYLKKHNS